MKQINLTNVKEAGEYSSLIPGAYICKLTSVEDLPDKEYLRVHYDIAEGEFANYYSDMRANHPDWANVGSYVKSYKEKALPMFKRFCTAVSKSNGNFVFDGGVVNADEKTLIGKKVGLVLGEEEYWSNSGDKKTRLYVYKEFPIDKIADQKVPDKKVLKDEKAAAEAVNDFMNIPDGEADEIPY